MDLDKSSLPNISDLHTSSGVKGSKIKDQDKNMSLQKVINMALWTHNMNVYIHSYTPLQQVTGKSIIFPGI